MAANATAPQAPPAFTCSNLLSSSHDQPPFARPSDVVDTPATCPVACALNGQSVLAGSMAPSVGKKALLMARPESLQRRHVQGLGHTTNVYLGSSFESFVTSEYGEILVQKTAK